jgi:hypothetical protein
MQNATGSQAAQLREFIAAWSDVYCFEYRQGGWHARRRDNGAVVHVATPEDLLQQVMQDYIAKPVRMRRS